MTFSSTLSVVANLFLLLLVLVLIFTTAPSLCNKPQNNMLPSEAETLFKVMESMSSDHTWRQSFPNPCASSSWPGIECKPAKDGYLHVSRLDFGSTPYPTCKKTATFPSIIFNLPHLQSLFFFNCFTSTKTFLSLPKNGIISSNSSLQQLSLRSNPALLGPIPPQIYSFKSLLMLTLSQNHLTGPIPIPTSSSSSSLVQHVDLSYNMLTGLIPSQAGGYFKSLVSLDLSYNSLTGSIPASIGQLSLLQKLDLSSNSLEGTIPDTIRNLKSLVFIALSDNKLRGGNFPKGMSQSQLQNLQYFIMDNNPMFIPLPVELGFLEKLQELRLSNSGYSGTIPSSFSQLNNLSALSLENNRLRGEIPAAFELLPHIYHLNLSRNFLGGVVPLNASFFKRLGRNLDLSGNPGLCLNPDEAYGGVKIGIGGVVSVCGKNGSSSQPLNGSSASSSSSRICCTCYFPLLHLILLFSFLGAS